MEKRNEEIKLCTNSSQLSLRLFLACLGFGTFVSLSLYSEVTEAFEGPLNDHYELGIENLFAGEQLEKVYEYQNQKLLESLNPYSTIGVSRAPANLIPDDDIGSVPFAQKGFIQRLFVEDNSGVLEGLRDDVQSWHEVEEYVHYWNLESTGIYESPDDDRKQRHLERQFWRYLDRRLSEEIDNASEGSALHTAGRLEDAVRPESSEVNFSDDYRLRFRVRPLRGQMAIQLENPFVDHELIVSASGRADMKISRDLAFIDSHASFNYHIDKGYTVAQLSKKLSNHITGRITHYSPGREHLKYDEFRRDSTHEGRAGIYYSRRF